MLPYDLWSFKKTERRLNDWPYIEGKIINVSYWFRRNNPAYRVSVRYVLHDTVIISAYSEWITQDEWPSFFIDVSNFKQVPEVGDMVGIRYSPKDSKIISLSNQNRLDYICSSIITDIVIISILLFFIKLPFMLKSIGYYKIGKILRNR
jgi:hypothetical protein